MLLLSRFWYLFLAVMAAAAVGAALLGQGIINAKSDRNLAEQLRRDRFELEAMLRLESRARLDAIAFITVDNKIGEILRKAVNVENEKGLWELNAQLKEVLRGHITRLAEAAPGKGTLEEKRTRVAPDIAIAVDVRGRIIAQLGPLMANPPGSGLGTFPLVRRALQGYLRDDIWVYDRRVYRMAARPIIYGGQYVGAILHGHRYDGPFIEKYAKNLGGASVAFFYQTDVLASYSPSDPQNAPNRQQMQKPLSKILVSEKFKQRESTDPVELEGDGLAIYSRVVGSAADVDVGYVIARLKEHIATPIELFNSASDQDIEALPITELVVIALGLFGIGLLFLFLERDRPFGQLVDKTNEIAQKERDRLIVTEWRGGFRKLADAINRAIDKEVEKAAEVAPTRKKVNLDEILGPTPEAGDSSAFFGFAEETKAPSETAKGFMLTPPPPSTIDSPKAPPRPPSKPKAAPALPQHPLKPLPSEKSADFDEDTHFKEVFSQYLATRRQCGESIEQLTFDKFLVTLRKNRDQIISKHGAVGVRFTVYVKQGKAALKAAPIKN
ncbi:MAG: hypothetical protein JXA30_16730 [Deltaproteobacteria bacterium]|nr:hypothetical protein [Deltaproteobacteria bacterium]